MKPETRLTVFMFYCKCFEELSEKMEEYVGYKVLPQDIWSINIEQFEISKLKVTLTILYWSAEGAQQRNSKQLSQ